MITFSTLENTNIAEITRAFNNAFSDYSVPLQLTEEQLAAKMKIEDIKPEYSVGAFKNNELIAFMLHGYKSSNGKPIAYNAGTGVIPSERGQQLTFKLYEFLRPLLQRQGINTVMLEVITNNAPAVNTYTKVGFDIVRELNCYKGSITLPHREGYAVAEIQELHFDEVIPFWDWEPTWQNSIQAMENGGKDYLKLGAFNNNEIIGYLIYNPKSQRVHQLAVHKAHRNKGVAIQLLGHICRHYTTEISLINIPVTATDTVAFWESIGLQKTVAQYEMLLNN